MANTEWIQKLLRQNAELELCQKASMLDDQQRAMKFLRQTVACAQRKFLGNDMPAPEPDEEDQMSVRLGDNLENHTHYHESKPEAKKGLGPFAAGLIGAGLLATGIGGLTGAWLVADAIKHIKAGSTTTVSPVVQGDGNTKYKLSLEP